MKDKIRLDCSKPQYNGYTLNFAQNLRSTERDQSRYHWSVLVRWHLVVHYSFTTENYKNNKDKFKFLKMG